MEMVGYLGDAQFGDLQQKRCFHEEHLVDVVDDSAPRDLTDYAGEIDGRDVELVGIEGDVVVFGIMTRQQTDEADEDFLHTLGCLAVNDGTVLSILQVKQEYGIEHAQHFTFIDMVGMKIADDLTHFRDEMLSTVCGQCLFRLMQLYDGQVGQMYEVADGWCLDGDMFIGHQTVAVKVVGSGDDGDWEAWRIDVQVVGVKRQFSPVVMNRHPPFVNHHKGEAGHKSMLQVGTEDFRCICLKAVHPVIPAFCGQIVANKYRQIFIQCVHLCNLRFLFVGAKVLKVVSLRNSFISPIIFIISFLQYLIRNISVAHRL